MPPLMAQRIRLLTLSCLMLHGPIGCGQNDVPQDRAQRIQKQRLDEESLRLLDAIRNSSHNEIYGRVARPLPGMEDGWPKFIAPLLQSLDDDDPEFVRKVAYVVSRLHRREYVREDEATAARTLMAYLNHEHATTRYHAARVLLRAIPTGRLGYLSPEAKELLLLWKPHAQRLEQYLDPDDPRAGVFIAASILRLDNRHDVALAYLRRQLQTLKDEYENNGFELSSSFPLLGDDAKQLVAIAIRHAKYDGAWAVPSMCGRTDLEDMGTIAVPFIVKEISQSESSLQSKDFRLESEGWHCGNVLNFLSLLRLMALNAKFTGTDLTSATPIVKRLTKSSNQKIKEAAQSTLEAFAQNQNGDGKKP